MTSREPTRCFDFGDVTAEEVMASLPSRIADLLANDVQTALPAIARSPELTAAVEGVAGRVASSHTVVLGDARRMKDVADSSIHLVVTSPPYWTLKEYEPHAAQLGAVADYEDFLRQIDRVWKEVYPSPSAGRPLGRCSR